MKTFKQDGKLLLILECDLYSHMIAQLTGEAKAQLYNATSCNEVVLDMAATQFIDSRGITFIVGLYKAAITMGKTFKIIGVNEGVYSLFELMRLNEIFTVEQIA